MKTSTFDKIFSGTILAGQKDVIGLIKGYFADDVYKRNHPRWKKEHYNKYKHTFVELRIFTCNIRDYIDKNSDRLSWHVDTRRTGHYDSGSVLQVITHEDRSFGRLQPWICSYSKTHLSLFRKRGGADRGGYYLNRASPHKNFRFTYDWDSLSLVIQSSTSVLEFKIDHGVSLEGLLAEMFGTYDFTLPEYEVFSPALSAVYNHSRVEFEIYVNYTNGIPTSQSYRIIDSSTFGRRSDQNQTTAMSIVPQSKSPEGKTKCAIM